MHPSSDQGAAGPVRRAAGPASPKIIDLRPMAHPDLSLVLPAYNEEARIERALEELARFCTEAGVALELIVSDDGSSDATVKVVRAIGRFLGGVLSEIISGPVGITGLVFLALLGLLIVRAYWETRPSKAQSMDSLIA